MKKNEKKYIFVIGYQRLVLYNRGLMCAYIREIHRFWLVVIALLLGTQILCAQEEALQFDTDKYDFGTIAEDGGKVEYTFRFKNLSSQPVIILSAHTSCGCTTSQYSRKPIKSGEGGPITVVFDPMNRPGRFSKSIKVSTSASAKPQVLIIEGMVTPRERSIEERYPFAIGEGVRFSTNFHAFSFIGRGESARETVEWVNTSNHDVDLRFIPKQSSGFFHIEAPDVLPAGGRGEFYITYSVPADSERYGTLDDLFYLELNGRRSRTMFSTNVVAVDKFNRAGEDMSSPVAMVTKKIIKFAEVKSSSMAFDEELEIVNDGVGDLIIRAIECGSEALECSLRAGDRIAAGESLRVRLTLDASKCDYGAWVERLRIITNDPRHPMQSVRLTAIVIE